MMNAEKKPKKPGPRIGFARLRPGPELPPSSPRSSSPPAPDVVVVELKLDEFNELLKQAKSANNYLNYPEHLTNPDVASGVKLCALGIYRAIVAVEEALRADHRFRWSNDHWERNLEQVTS